MARIKINDSPRDMKISKEEMKKVLGGSSAVGVNAMGIGAGGKMPGSSPAMYSEKVSIGI